MRACLLCFFLCTLARADIRFAVGSFTQGATSVTTSDGGGSFAPKALILSFTSLTAAGSVAGARHGVGFASSNGPTKINTWAEASDSGGATANTTNRRASTVDRGTVFYEGTTVVGAATITFVSTGFTYSWTTNDATARIVNYIAIGGSDIVNTKAGSINTPASPGTVTTTVSFAPTIVFYVGGAAWGNYPVTPAANFSFTLGVGLGTSTTTAGGIGSQSTSAVATSVANSVEVSKSLQLSSSSAGSTFAAADVSAMDSTSFTTNFTTSSASTIGYLAIGGGTWAVGRTNQPTSTGDQAITVTGVHPVGAFFFSANKATSASYTNHVRNSLGASDGTHNFNVAWGQKHGATVQVASTSMDQTNVLRMMTEGGASPTTQATVDTVAFADNTLTPHWSVADATAREYVYVTIGTVVGGGGGSTVVPHRVNQ